MQDWFKNGTIGNGTKHFMNPHNINIVRTKQLNINVEQQPKLKIKFNEKYIISSLSLLLFSSVILLTARTGTASK
jgi:hypothetical protein